MTTEKATQNGNDRDEETVKCYTCPETFESVEDMTPVDGKGNRSPRHFCKECAERVQRGPAV